MSWGLGLVVQFVLCLRCRESFNSVKTWIEQIRNIRGDDAYIIVVGNKLENNRERETTIGEAQKLADELEVDFIEVSSK